MPTGFLQSVQFGPGFWTLSLGVAAALLSLVGSVWLARYRYRLNCYKAETERQLMLREQARLDLIAQRDQERLDRALDAQLDTIAHALERLESKPQVLFSFPSLAETSREPARVEQRAA